VKKKRELPKNNYSQVRSKVTQRTGIPKNICRTGGGGKILKLWQWWTEGGKEAAEGGEISSLEGLGVAAVEGT